MVFGLNRLGNFFMGTGNGVLPHTEEWDQDALDAESMVSHKDILEAQGPDPIPTAELPKPRMSAGPALKIG